MRFDRIHIENFRAIREFTISNLKDLVVIAGPNGCGKSCILDAIRLLKSVHGGYQSNEWQMWFGEFQLNLNNRTNLRGLFRDPSKPLVVEADLIIDPQEATYLKQNAERLCELVIWEQETKVGPESFGHSSLSYAAQFPTLVEHIKARTKVAAISLKAEADVAVHRLEARLTSDAGIDAPFSLLAKVVFTTFEPDHIGIIDFHSASRTYARESVGGVNLDLKAIETTRRASTLYNSQVKYSNVKSELLAMYFRSVVAKEAGQDVEAFSRLDSILKELFRIFFPDKEYLGVRAEPDGSVSFPVRLSSGEEHDINDLSSGEKEVLYGYLRLRSATPGNSTILLDEPELHLNPALLQGFPDFYYRHLSQAANNQVWLVTHSDVLLRQAVGNPNFTVIHMVNASLSPLVGNQAVLIGADDLQAAVLDLVGDLAAYRPTGKVVIFEGGGNSEFDVHVVERLFPRIAQNNNLISGGSKARVATLRGVLGRAATQAGIGDRVYAITDRDGLASDLTREIGSEVLTWDVYHIENYLLEPAYLFTAYRSLTDGTVLSSEVEAMAAAEQIAKEQIERLVLIRLQEEVNGQLRDAMGVRASPDSATPAADLLPSIEGTFSRLEALRISVANLSHLATRESTIRSDLQKMFTDGSWRYQFPGRIILKAFVDTYLAGSASYEGFVNLVLSQMVTDGFRPAGMVSTLTKIFPALETEIAGSERQLRLV